MYYAVSILGCIWEKDCYGYEIKQKMRDMFASCTKISNNSLYPILKRFEKSGATRKTVEAVEGKPSRIVYSITDAGRREFVAMLRDFPDALMHSRDDFLMRLHYFPYLDRPARERALCLRRTFLEESMALIEKRCAQHGGTDLTDFHVHLNQLELDVIQKYEKRLGEPCLLTPEGHLSTQ